MLTYQSIEELLARAEQDNQSIGETVLADQALLLQEAPEGLMARMQNRLTVMRQAVESGLEDPSRSASGLSGGAAHALKRQLAGPGAVLDPLLVDVMAKALAVAEVNARMGRIVAAPTAGSCGIIPGLLLTVAQKYQLDDHQLILSLFTASGFGLVIAHRASLSGAEGGCQAECGSAAGMAAAAAVELVGGSPRQSAQACALALKNALGLSCDPVAGLVEVPCIKRNAGQAACALAAVELAMAGVSSEIPLDDVLDAMKDIGDQMPVSLKETAGGGLATTPTALAAARRLSQSWTHEKGENPCHKANPSPKTS